MNDKQQKALEYFLSHNNEKIIEARANAIKAGGHPDTMYIGDIFPHPQDKVWISPVNIDTGAKFMGMRIVSDFRVPMNTFYITYGDLSYPTRQNLNKGDLSGRTK